MTHPNRSRYKANVRRKLALTLRGKPLPLAKQNERAAANALAHLRRYPDPPRYRYSYDYPKPEQPACYHLQSI